MTSAPALENVADVYPLTPLQEGMLFHALADAGSDVFFNQITATLRGALDIARFEAACRALVARHAVLRTAFLWDGLDRPLQVVREEVDLDWTLLDLSDLDRPAAERRIAEVVAADRARGFDLAAAPLTRMTLVEVGAGEYRWLWSTHHLLADGWSMQIMLDDLFSLYRGGASPESLGEPFPYRSFVSFLDRRDHAGDEAFWRRQLEGFTEPHRLVVPGLPPDPAAHGFDSRLMPLEPDLAERVAEVARRERVTLSTAYLGAWALVLSRWMRDPDVVFGVTSSGREASLRGIERGVGLFINTLPTRIRVEPGQRLGEWLRSVQAGQIAAREYEQSSLAEVQKWAGLERGDALFESIFVFENLPARVRAGDTELTLGDVDFVEHSNYPLAVLVHPGEEFAVRFVYDSSRLPAEAVDGIGSQLRTVLDRFGAGDDPVLSAIPLTSGGEAGALDDLGAGPPLPADERTAHEVIEGAAQRDPSAPAVISGERAIDYGELMAAADRVAALLRSAGVGPDRLVGLLIPRSIEMVVGLLAILKAGGAYVPLDPSYPARHIAGLLEEGSIDVVLTDTAHRDRVPDSAAVVDVEGSPPSAGSAVAPAGPDHLAYVIHTSGSTGRPKGVMVTHRNLVASTRARDVHYGSGVGTFLLLSSFAFDSSIAGLFWTLFSGGTLVLPAEGEEHDVARLSDLVRDHQVTHLLCLPGLYQLLMEQGGDGALQSLEVAIVAGEACPAGLLETHRALLPAAELHNEYGPTEATVWCTAHRATAGDEGRPLPIGRPVAGTRLYLLDEAGHRVPAGFPGELCVGGAGLTPGYLESPDLTDEKFVSVPGAERVYRTGDLACFRPDGTLLFLGRADQQLKIRGYRIEPGAVEAALHTHPAVAESAVVGRTSGNGGAAQLVAYVVPAATSFEGAEVRADLLRSVPLFMVPDRFVALDRLPRLPNGKVDIGSLAACDVPASDDAGFDPPRTPIESTLAEIWAGVLGVDRSEIGRNSDFFALGGHSLLAIRIMAALRKKLDVSLPLAALFDAPRLAELALLLESRGGDEAGPASALLVPIRAGGSPPVHFIHPGGGNVLVYEPVVRHLPGEIGAIGVQARGADGRGEPDRDFAVMAARYADEIANHQPQGAVHLVGYSTGGLIAYEAARLLLERGRTIGSLILLDTVFPVGGDLRARFGREAEIVRRGGMRGLRTVASWWWGSLRLLVGRIRHGYKWKYLAARGRPLSPELAAKRINHIALRAQGRFRPAHYPGTMLYVRATGDERRRFHGSLERWQAVAGRVIVREAPGRHAGRGNMVTEPHARVVAGIIADSVADRTPVVPG